MDHHDYSKSFCATFLAVVINYLPCEHVKLIKLFLHLMCFYLHFIFIKISSWLHLLLEWFWSLVKLHVFQCPHNCLKKRKLWIQNLEKVKIRKRLGNFHFKRGGLPYYGVVRNFSFSWGLSFLGVEVEGGGVISQEVSTLHTTTQEEQPSDKGRQDFTQVEWGAHFCIKRGGRTLREAAHYMVGE